MTRPFLVACLASFSACLAPLRPVAPLVNTSAPAVTDEAFRAAPPPRVPVAERIDAPPREWTLDNGLRVLLFERPGSDVFSARLIFNRSATDLGDPGGVRMTQMSYLYARTGSETGFERTSNETVRSGATWKWQAGRFFGWSQVKGPAQSLEASLALLRTATLDANLTVEEYERRAKSWMSLATTRTPSPLEAESFVLFGKGPYGFAGRGTTMVSLAQAKALHSSLLQPAHSTLVVVGNVDPERLKAGVARSFAAWRSSDAVTKIEEPPPRRQGARLAFVPRLAKTQIFGSVFALGPGPTSEDATAFALLAQLLGGTPFSEFEETLREDLGAAYSFGSRVFVLRNASWLTTFASYQQDKAVDGVEATLSAIRNLRAGKVTDDEVDMVRERAAGGWREWMATVEGAAALYGSAVTLDTNLDWIRDYPSRLRAVQKADIERAANSYLSDRALHVLFVGDLRWLRAENLGFGGPTELKLPE